MRHSPAPRGGLSPTSEAGARAIRPAVHACLKVTRHLRFTRDPHPVPWPTLLPRPRPALRPVLPPGVPGSMHQHTGTKLIPPPLGGPCPQPPVRSRSTTPASAFQKVLPSTNEDRHGHTERDGVKIPEFYTNMGEQTEGFSFLI